MRNARWIGSSVVVLLAGQGAWAQAQTVVDLTTLPFTISEPGTYVLDTDWAVTTVDNGQTMIDITASDVVLDLHGFEIAQDGSEGVTLVAIAGDRVTVSNGRLKGRRISAIAFRSTGATTVVDSVNVEDSATSSFEGNGALIRSSQFVAKGGVGVTGTGSRIERSDISCNQGSLSVGPAAQVRDNRIWSFQGTSVTINGDGSLFRNNTVVNAQTFGAGVAVAGNDNAILENTVQFDSPEASSPAIRVAGTRNVIRGNLAVPSTAASVPPRWATGIRFQQDGNFYGNNQMAATVPFDLGGTVQTDWGSNVGY